MGLDISVYSNLKFLVSREELEKQGVDDHEMDEYYNNHVCIFVNTHFIENADHLVTGFYDGEYEMSFRAGSYSGYSHFRDLIAELVYDKSFARVVRDITHKGGPFWEFLNFSDCEGCIGPATSAKLYQDFEEHFDKLIYLPEKELRYVSGTYESFMQAFYIASTKNGVVVYH
jgi:hypothetical protein